MRGAGASAGSRWAGALDGAAARSPSGCACALGCRPRAMQASRTCWPWWPSREYEGYQPGQTWIRTRRLVGAGTRCLSRRRVLRCAVGEGHVVHSGLICLVRSMATCRAVCWKDREASRTFGRRRVQRRTLQNLAGPASPPRAPPASRTFWTCSPQKSLEASASARGQHRPGSYRHSHLRGGMCALDDGTDSVYIMTMGVFVQRRIDDEQNGIPPVHAALTPL